MSFKSFVGYVGFGLGIGLGWSCSVLAGPGSSGGGDAIVCYPRTQEGKEVQKEVINRLIENQKLKPNYRDTPFDEKRFQPERVESFDLYLAKRKNPMGEASTIVPIPEELKDSITGYLGYLTDRIEQKTTFGTQLREAYHQMPLESHWDGSPGVGEVYEAPDTTMVPESCILVQMAYQDDGWISYDQHLFEKMDLENKTALFLHEYALYVFLNAPYRQYINPFTQIYRAISLIMTVEPYEGMNGHQMNQLVFNTLYPFDSDPTHPSLAGTRELWGQTLLIPENSIQPNGWGEYQETGYYRFRVPHSIQYTAGVNQFTLIPKSTAKLFPDQTLQEGYIEEALITVYSDQPSPQSSLPLHQVQIKVGKYVLLHPFYEGKQSLAQVHLPEPGRVNVLNQWIDFAGYLSFYPNGRVQEGTLEKPQTLLIPLGGYQKLGGKISFHDNGKMKCVNSPLSADESEETLEIQFQGSLIYASQACFTAEGVPTKIVVARESLALFGEEDGNNRKIILSEKDTIDFDPPGIPTVASLRDLNHPVLPVRIQDKKLLLQVNRRSFISTRELLSPLTVQTSVGPLTTERVPVVSAGGKILEIFLQDEDEVTVEVGGIEYEFTSAYSYIDFNLNDFYSKPTNRYPLMFYTNGAVKSGLLASTSFFSGGEGGAGDIMEFDRDGKVTKIIPRRDR